MTDFDRVQRDALIQGLRDFLTFIETHPEAPLNYAPSLMAHVETVEELKAAGRLMGSAMKDFNGDYVSLKKSFGPICYDVYIRREKVCEKRVVGSRHVHAHDEDLVEWDCKESIFGL
jgi:hypothetical protein